MLKDKIGRVHNYLRISLTEKCNLRCTYCMPEDGILLSPKESLMTKEEILQIARVFAEQGVSKIRLTGGEPLLRKDFEAIVLELSKLPVKLAITTNGLLIDRHIDVFAEGLINKVNISIDSLDKAKFKQITRIDQFGTVWNNIQLLIRKNIRPKLNVVLIKGFNENEIVDFVELTKTLPITIQFIEYMPFNGNKWDLSQCVTLKEVLETIKKHYGNDLVLDLHSEPNDTSKNFKIKGFEGEFGIISTISNPFCDSCNRIRITANGKMKNCLFSNSETDILTPLRAGKEILPLIKENLQNKKKMLGGHASINDNEAKEISNENRSMILIGG